MTHTRKPLVRRIGAILRLACWLACVPFAAHAAPAADTSARYFDIPADAGDKALKQFSEQSGVAVVFGTATAAQVRTNALKGTFAPRDAIAMMLEGTGLVVVPNEKTGALTVSRSPNVARAAQPTASDRPTPASDRNPATPDSSEVVQLSPFEIVADNKGYYAANTMSGTRLNTKLEDLASSVTVVTKEQMQDFGLLDLNDIFLYEANTEGSGNYTDFVIDRRGNVVDNIGDNPQGANRIRGVGAANIALGNFATSGRAPIDQSTFESIEISRGPNSNIFGLGNAAGTVNLIPSMANTSRNRAQTQFRVDSTDGYRGSLDINRVLKKDVLAVRGSAVYQHDGFVRKPSGTDTQRYNAMVKFQPFKNTTIRASYNYYYLNGTRANTLTPRDAISYWKSIGSPSWDPSTSTVKRNGQVIGTFPAGTTLPDYFALPFSTDSQLFVDQGGLKLWTVGQTSTNSNPSSQSGSPRYVETQPPPVRATQPLFSTWPAVSDKSLYDWENVNLNAINYIDDRDNTAMAELEQTFLRTDRHLLALQLGWFRETAKRYNHNPMGSAAGAGVASALAVDANEKLLDGTPNPFFGRPYIGIAEPLSVRDQFQNDTYRTQLAYRLDLTREHDWKRWLGMHEIVGYYEYKESTRRVFRYRDAISDVHAWLPFGNQRGNQGTSPGSAIARTYTRYYLGDNVGPNVDYSATDYRRGSYPFTWFNGSTRQWINEPATLDEVASLDNSGGSQNQRNVLKTDGIVFQNHFLRNRVVTTFGFREDKNFTMFGGTPQLQADGLTFDYDAMNSWTDVWNPRSGRTKTAGIVVKPLRWLNIYANKSDSFQPTSPAQNLLRQTLPNPQGKGEDYGFALNLFDGKLVIRANQYTTKQINSPYGQSGTFATRILGEDFGTQYNNNKTTAFSRQAQLWIRAAATARGQTLTDAQVNAEMYRQMGLTEADLAAFQALPTTDVSDITGKGKEIEINYNPTNFWTLKLNVVQQKAIDSNLSPALLAWVNQRLPIWTTAIDQRTGQLYWHTDYGGGNGTPEQFYQTQILAPIKLAQATEGQARPQVRQYRFNASTNLQLAQFTEHSILKRFNVGGAVRWEDKGAIGYYGKQTAPAPITELDGSRPIWDTDHIYVDAFVGYRMRLFANKVGAKFQLNVRNLNESGRLQPIAAYPDGNRNTFRIIDPRQFILTATFDL